MIQPVPVGTATLPVQRVAIYWGPVNGNELPAPITFDATLNESHVRDADVTEYPVEEGTDIVDHIRPKPFRLTLETYVSNAPLRSTDAQRLPLSLTLTPTKDQSPGILNSTNPVLSSGPDGSVPPALHALGVSRGLPPTINPVVDQFTGDTDYAKNTFDQLTDLQQAGALLRIVTPRQPLYTDMVIKTLTMRRDKSAGTGAWITIELVQIRIVASLVVPAPQPTVPRAGVVQPTGKQDAKPADDGPTRSVLDKFLHDHGVAGQ